MNFIPYLHVMLTFISEPTRKLVMLEYIHQAEMSHYFCSCNVISYDLYYIFECKLVAVSSATQSRQSTDLLNIV